MSSAIQVAKTATYLPDLVEVQRASFKWFLEKGLIEACLEAFQTGAVVAAQDMGAASIAPSASARRRSALDPLG